MEAAIFEAKAWSSLPFGRESKYGDLAFAVICGHESAAIAVPAHSHSYAGKPN